MGKVRLFAAALVGFACATSPAVRSEAKPAAEPSLPPPPRVEPSATAVRPSGPSLVFNVQPPEAEVVVDGVSHGSVRALGAGGMLRVLPGIYRVSLRAPGYITWRAEVAVKDAPEVIQVTLAGAH
jgi:hypothetical protein